MWNRKGQAVFLMLMLAVTFFFLGLILAPAVNVSVDSARTTADCSNVSIDTSMKVFCSTLDLGKPYIVAIIFGLAGALVGGIVIR